jgi:hypothetical protein
MDNQINKIIITFELEETNDTATASNDRVVEDLFEHIDKLGFLRNKDTIDLIRGHRETTYHLPFY